MDATRLQTDFKIPLLRFSVGPKTHLAHTCHECKCGHHEKCTVNINLNHGQKGTCKCRVCSKKADLDAICT